MTENQKVKIKDRNTVEIFYPTKKEIQRKDHWYPVTNKQWLIDWKNLNLIQISIMVSLLLHMSKSGQCWPGEQTIAGEVKKTKLAVLRNIKVLEKKGFLFVKRTKGRCNEYFFPEDYYPQEIPTRPKI